MRKPSTELMPSLRKMGMTIPAAAKTTRMSSYDPSASMHCFPKRVRGVVCKMPPSKESDLLAPCQFEI